MEKDTERELEGRKHIWAAAEDITERALDRRILVTAKKKRGESGWRLRGHIGWMAENLEEKESLEWRLRVR